MLSSEPLMSKQKDNNKQVSILSDSRSIMSSRVGGLSGNQSKHVTFKQGTVKNENMRGNDTSNSDTSSDDSDMSMQHEFAYLYENRRDVVPITKIQLELWTSVQSPLFWAKMWHQKLNTIQKVALWNSLKFPYKYLKVIEKMYPNYDLGKVTDLFTEPPKVSIEEVKAPTKPKKLKKKSKKKMTKKNKKDESGSSSDSSNSSDEPPPKLQLSSHQVTEVLIKLKNIICEKIGRVNFKGELFSTMMVDESEQIDATVDNFKIYQDIDDNSDIKSPLWFALTLEEKISMLLHQSQESQMIILLTLLTCQHGPTVEKCKGVEKKVETLLNSLIYEKYMGLCQVETYKTRHHITDLRREKLRKENDRQIFYLRMLYDKMFINLSLQSELSKNLEEMMKMYEIFPEDPRDKRK